MNDGEDARPRSHAVDRRLALKTLALGTAVVTTSVAGKTALAASGRCAVELELPTEPGPDGAVEAREDPAA